MSKYSRFVDQTAQRLISMGFSSPAPTRFSDADGAYFFAQQLEQIETRVYEVQYADLLFRQLFPVDTSTPAGAAFYGYTFFDKVGRAKIINPQAKDIPWSDVSRGKVFRKADWIGTKFGYDYGDIQAAMYTGEPLEQNKANAARRAIEELFNELVWYGDDEANIIGIFNNSDIVQSVVPDGVSTNPEWSTKTPDEIVADVNKLFTDPWTSSHGKEKLTDMALPLDQYSLIANTRITDLNMTIMQFIVQNSIWINSAANIHPVSELAGAGPGPSDVMFGWTRSPDKIQVKILQDVTFHPVQQVGLNFEIIVTGKSGGVKLPYPASAYILYGI